MREDKGCSETAATEKVDEARREALVKIARFSAYTAPALLVMLTGAAYAQGDSLGPT